MILKRAFSKYRAPFIMPKLVVFDLDHTVWPFGIDSYCFIPPYHQYQGKVVDMSNQEITHFPDIPRVMEYLHSKGIEIGVASRTKFPTGAIDILKLFEFDKFIKYWEIYPGQKMKHFSRIKEQSGFNYRDMIFFDDEPRNIEDIGPLGVLAVLVDRDAGVTCDVFKKSLADFNKIKHKQV